MSIKCNQRVVEKTKKAHSMAIKALHNTQKRNRQIKDYLRSVPPQNSHQMSNVKDVNIEEC